MLGYVGGIPSRPSQKSNLTCTKSSQDIPDAQWNLSLHLGDYYRVSVGKYSLHGAYGYPVVFLFLGVLILTGSDARGYSARALRWSLRLSLLLGALLELAVGLEEIPCGNLP